MNRTNSNQFNRGNVAASNQFTNPSIHDGGGSMMNGSRSLTIPSNPNGHEKLMLMEDSDDDKACFQVCAGPRSPLNWICEKKGNEKKPNTNHAMNGGNGANQKNHHHHNHPSSKLPSNTNHHKKDLRVEARKKVAQNFFHTDSDEENGNQLNTTHAETLSPEMTANSNGNTMLTNDLMSSNTNGTNNQNQTYIHISSPDPGQSRPIQGEARIVAPHVSKLAPYSAVEVRLQSPAECVAVLCSVDVLKMRSGFFHDVLNEQEKSLAAKHSANSSVAINHPLHSNLIWRDPIVIPESTPFEAAAFLESLHEGRALFKGEWNYSWARLSVTWVVEELILEYASQIEDHMNRIASAIQNNHWRTNPSVLSGMRVAVFRKSTGNYPTVITGIVLESPPNIGYSKIRVAFENDRSVSRTNPSNYLPPPSTTTAAYNTFSPQDTVSVRLSDFSDIQIPNLARSSSTMYSYNGPSSVNGQHQNQNAKTSPTPSTITSTNEQQIVGDVTEPIWVQSPKEGSPWYEPDELFLLESKRYLSNTDKRIFWEMARALIELPEISLACKSGIKNSAELANALKRPEYRVLWTKDAPDHLPKEIATELVRSAYLSSYNQEKA